MLMTVGGDHDPSVSLFLWGEETMRSTIFIICLVALLSAIIPPVSATTWYVDDSGGADFTAIQDAVNAASPGDTVRVRDGTYREVLAIDRQVTLEAVNRGMVRIVVSAAAQVTADGVTIRGIVIRGSDEIPRVRPWQDLSLTSVNDCTIEGCEFWDGGIVLSNCRNCTVRDSIFTETYRAVDLEGSHGNLIEGNLISWNRDYAIYSESSSDNRIIRNRMYGAEGGGTIDLWNSHNNTIAENVLDGYDPFGAQSLCFHTGSSGNIVYLNDFLNSNSPTLFSEAGSNIWNATTPVTYTWNNRTLTGYPGNYWQVPDGSGYSGSDGDGDGLGDTPYTLRKSTESDCHPLMAPMAGYLPEEETAPTWIVVSPATPTIVAGETRPFLARYSDQHGVRLYDLPVVWSCDNPAVGTIDDDGLFTAAGPGTATVTAAVGSLAAQAYVTVVEQTPAEGNVTIVVDQSGSGDYTTIGAAVAAAGAGDRIVVHSGTYTETVQVTTPVSITGASGAKSTIVKAPDTGSPCVIVLSGGVSMTGFTVSGGKRAPAVLARGVSGGRIADVVAKEAYEGIRLDDCSGIRIENLTVPGLVDDVRETHLGVVLVNGSSGNRIEGCTMHTKEYAVWIEDGTGNSVTGSMLYGRARGGSVALFRSDANTVTGNDLNCPNMGLHGVFLWQSANNRIWFNNFLEGHIHTFSTESRNFWVSETPVSYSFDGKEYTGQLGNYWEVVAGYPDNGYAGSDGDGDGVGDTAYAVPHCDSGDVDARPLVQQIGGYTPAPPAADFTANVTSGEAPLAVAFTDASVGAASWSWEFGDGATSARQNPVHTYTAAGIYTVTLTAANSAGSSSATGIVTVQEIPAAPPQAAENFTLGNGAVNITTGEGGGQQVTFNATAGTGNVTGNDILLQSGGLNVTIRTDGLTANGSVSTGNVTGVHLESAPVNATVGNAGNVSVSFEAEMNGYNPALGITASIYDQPGDTANTAFVLAAQDENLELAGIAYAVYFTKTNLTGNDTIRDAVLRLTVSPGWVDANGGIDTVRIFRLGDDGNRSVLQTTYEGMENGMMVFTAVSPEGFSAFALGAVAGPAPAPASSGSSGGGSSQVSVGAASNLKIGDSVTFPMDRTAITAIALTADDDVKEVMVTVEKGSLPRGAEAPAGTVYQYIETNLYKAAAGNFSALQLRFAVPTAWLAGQGCTAKEIGLFRHTDEGWRQIPVEVLDEEGGDAIFSASADAFGLFAITVTGKATGEPTSGPTGTTTTPVAGTTTLPAEPPVEEPPAEGFPATTLAFVAVTIVIIAAAGYVFFTRK